MGAGDDVIRGSKEGEGVALLPKRPAKRLMGKRRARGKGRKGVAVAGDREG